MNLESESVLLTIIEPFFGGSHKVLVDTLTKSMLFTKIISFSLKKYKNCEKIVHQLCVFSELKIICFLFFTIVCGKIIFVVIWSLELIKNVN